MPALEIIAHEPNGGLSFGDHTSVEKLKSDDFEVTGDVYKVKTHSEITRVEKNGKLLFESFPGATVRRFRLNEKLCEFSATGASNAQITIELEPETEYELYIGGVSVGKSNSNRSSKFNFSVELNDTPKDVRIVRV